MVYNKITTIMYLLGGIALAEFRYVVLNAKGETLTGNIEAESEDICRNIITQRGLFCLEVSPASLASRSLNFGGKPKFKTKELNIFCRQFSTMLLAGIGVIKALDIIHSQTENQKLKKIIKNVYETVQKGQSFSSALKSQSPAFPELMINLVEAGEASGTLDKVMIRVADHFEKEQKTTNKVKGAMMYPIILGILTVGVVALLMIMVIPVFAKMFSSMNIELPIPTKIVMGTSGVLTNYWYIIIIVIFGASFFWTNYLKNPINRVKWDKFKTKIPAIGKLSVIIISARFARTLSTLMSSGIPLLKCLEIAGKVLGNKFFEGAVKNIREDIRKGTQLSTAIRKVGIFPLMLLSMITIGEESGTLDDVLHKTAIFYDDESDTAITKMVGMLEPLMIIVMAAIIGFIVISVMLPMMGMMQNVGKK